MNKEENESLIVNEPSYAPCEINKEIYKHAVFDIAADIFEFMRIGQIGDYIIKYLDGDINEKLGILITLKKNKDGNKCEINITSSNKNKTWKENFGINISKRKYGNEGE